MQKVHPCLWFDDRIEDAVNLYVSVFPGARILSMNRYREAGPLEKGKVLTVEFELQGQVFTALNGGPQYQFTPAVSFIVDCETQAEVDHYWHVLGEGGSEQQCGWLTDRFGLSWQIVPKVLGRYLSDPDPARANRVMQAMLQMVKLDIAGLERAYAA